jgi:hypothetical protein
MQEIQAYLMIFLKLRGYCVIPISTVSEFLYSDLNLIGLLTKFMSAVHTPTIGTGPCICMMVYTTQ